MPPRVLSAVLAWGMANAAAPTPGLQSGGAAPRQRTAGPRVLLWPESPAVAAELPARIDPRFSRADLEAFDAELAAAQAGAQDTVRTRLTAIEASLALAREHFVAQRWDEMSAALERIERDDLALVADPRRCDVLWEVEFRLGLVGRGRSQADETRRRNLLALALAPARRPARELYGPQVVAEFLDAVDARAGQVAVPVQIDVEPHGAVVHVDCQPVHGTHVDLPPGLHVVHARAMGATTQAVMFEVPQQTTVAVALADDGDDAVARLGRSLADGPLVLELPAHRRALVEAAAARDVDVVVQVATSGDAAIARALVGAARGPSSRRASIELAVAAALAGVADDGTLRATPSGTQAGSGAQQGHADARPARKPIVRAWWFWTTIAVVAAAGLGLGLGLGLRDHPSDRIIVYGPK